MAEFLGHINPADDTFIISGHIITGYADDDKINIERDNDVMNKLVGTNGEFTLATNLDTTGTITLRLQETSVSNEFLWGIMAGIKTGAIRGIVPYACQRNGGASSLKAGVCWIQAQPSMGYGSEPGVYEWVLGIADASSGLSGIVDSVEQATDVAGFF